MANEQLTIAQNDARLTVIGKSWADVTTDSGDGITIDQFVIGEIEDITGLDLPDIGDDTRIIIGYDDSGDPWLYIDGLDDPYDLGDLDLDLLDLDFELGSSLAIGDLNVSVDDDLKIKEEELPTSIVIVTEPKKLRYVEGSRIDLSGMVVTAKKEDGSTWTSAKYPNGHIPLGELIVDPISADLQYADYTIYEQDGIVCAGIDCSIKRDGYYASGMYYYGSYVTAGLPTPGSANLPFYRFTGRSTPGLLLVTKYAGYVFCTHLDDGVIGYKTYCTFGDPSGEEQTGHIVGGTIGQGYFALSDWLRAGDITIAPESSADPSAVILDDPKYRGGNVTVTVSWLRPGDSMPLSASFVITVEPRRGNGGR